MTLIHFPCLNEPRYGVGVPLRFQWGSPCGGDFVILPAKPTSCKRWDGTSPSVADQGDVPLAVLEKRREIRRNLLWDLQRFSSTVEASC